MQGNPIAQARPIFTLSMSGKEALPLRAGETVTAEVLHTGANGAATIRIMNTALDVHADVPIQKGDTLTLRIERQENTVYLRLAGSVADQVACIKNTLLSALEGPEKLGSGTEGMARLVELLNALPEQLRENLPEIDIVSRFLLQIGRLTGKTLEDVVQNGGVFFESKLRILALGMEDDAQTEIETGRIIAGDLKASLLRLKDTFLDPTILERLKEAVPPDELIGALNAVLRNIEFYQLQSKLTDSLWFFLPLVWPHLKDGELILRESDLGKFGGRSFSCAMNLDLERAGKLRVSLLFQGGYIHVNCAAENSVFFRLLREGADTLEQQFRTAGLRLGNFAAFHLPEVRFSGVRDSGPSIYV